MRGHVHPGTQQQAGPERIAFGACLLLEPRILLVEPPDAEVEIPGKSDPEEVGDLQQPGPAIHLGEQLRHP